MLPIVRRLIEVWRRVYPQYGRDSVNEMCFAKASILRRIRRTGRLLGDGSG